jgi:hypothetical protein
MAPKAVFSPWAKKVKPDRRLDALSWRPHQWGIMAHARDTAFARDLLAIFEHGVAGGLSDGQLLERFAGRGCPAAELAFEALVVRQQRMVLVVCPRVLGDGHEAEDAFQATFLVLARKARTLRVRDLLRAGDALDSPAPQGAMRCVCEV